MNKKRIAKHQDRRRKVKNALEWLSSDRFAHFSQKLPRCAAVLPRPFRRLQVSAAVARSLGRQLVFRLDYQSQAGEGKGEGEGEGGPSLFLLLLCLLTRRTRRLPLLSLSLSIKQSQKMPLGKFPDLRQAGLAPSFSAECHNRI